MQLRSILSASLFLCCFSVKAQKDTLQSVPFQFSVVPTLSTNGAYNSRCVNQFSVNLLAGYAGGLNGLEIGAFLNLLKGDMRGLQLAGFANVVGGSTTGSQFAGFCNVSRKAAAGIQMSGFANVVSDSMKGIQVTGFVNVNSAAAAGWQCSGFSNINSGSYDGFQASGFMNMNTGYTRGVQLAGFGNISTDTLRGSQVAGFINVARGRTEGIQVAGFLNVSGKLRGVQLGFINYADSLESGTPLGFLSFIGKGGYHAVELTSNETFAGGVQFKLGSERFYNLFNLNMHPGSTFYWGWGYGAGTCIKNTGWFRVNLDAFAIHVNENELWTNALNLLGKAQLGLTWQLSSKVAITAGPTFNTLITRKEDNEGLVGTTIAPWTVFDRVYNDDTRVQFWPGFHAAVRF